ncbi:MAG: VWA domain-containing protein [Halopseudomonas sp.]
MRPTAGDDLAPVQGSRDWVFVLDISGSMTGKYATLLEGVRQGLQQLPQGDRFRLITFNNKAYDISNGYQPVDANTIERLLKQLESNGVSGGTNLFAGLAKGIRQLDDDRASAIVLVTDGVANVGTTEKKAFLKLLQDHDVRLFTFIMGNSANRPLLDEMTQVSNGFSSSVSNADDVLGQILQATSKMGHASLRDIEVEIDGVRVSELTPERIGSVYRGQQLVLFGHYFKPGTAQLTLKGKIGAEQRVYQTRVEFPQQATANPEVERLWAYSRIEALQAKLDYFGSDVDTEQAITDLAVQHGLVTNYTSLLVVEEEVFQQLGIERKNQQRVAREDNARQQREQRKQVKDTRADQQQPMFKNNRPSFGGGAVDPSIMVLLTALLASAWVGRRVNANATTH